MAMYIRWLAFSLILCAAALGNQSTLRADAIDINEFRTADESRQRQMVKEAINRRIALLQNLSFDSVSMSGERVLEGATVRDSNEWSSRILNGVKYREGSYQLASQMFGEDAQTPIIESRSSFDQQIGESRALSLSNGGRKLAEGRRDRLMDDTVFLNRGAFFLLDLPDTESYRLYSEMLRAEAEWSCQLNAASREISIAFPFRHPKVKSTDVEGKCELVFTYTEESLVPTQFKSSWTLPLVKDAPTYSLSTTLSDARKIEGLTIPHLILEITRSSDMSEDVCVYRRTELSAIKMNGVTRADALIDFPIGTAVVDVIDGLSYTIGPDSERLKVKPLLR
jgi:hypothetical protein